jgi:hypothetical protein
MGHVSLRYRRPWVRDSGLSGRWPEPSADQTPAFLGVVQPVPRHGWYFDKGWFKPQVRWRTFEFEEAGLYEFFVDCRTAPADNNAMNFSENTDKELHFNVRVST